MLKFCNMIFQVYIYYDLKLPNSCIQSLSKCIENDNQLSEMLEKYEGPSRRKIINTCLYRFNPNN